MAKKEKVNPVLTIREQIRKIALEEGVSPALAIRVAECESSLNPNAVHRNFNGTCDRGIFQWNNYWHPEVTDEMAFDVKTATRLFCQAYLEGHLDWWNSSRKCWSK